MRSPGLPDVFASPLIGLDDDGAGVRDVVGDKAWGLARARAAGLPVLRGWVVPTTTCRGALAAAASRVRRGSATPATALAALPIDPRLVASLNELGAELRGPAIVRSSGLHESDPRWAGALSSFHEVTAHELASAVRGCWSSAIAPGALRSWEVLPASEPG